MSCPEPASPGWCAGCGGRDLAGALPQGVCACRCAASALAGDGLRKGLDRQRAWGWLRVSGSGLGLRVTHDSSFLRSRATVLRWRVPSVDLPPSERSTGGRSTADGARCGNDASFSWNGPREGRIVRLPAANRGHDSSFACTSPNASAFSTRSRRRRRILGPSAHERSILRPPRARPAARDPRPARPPAARSRPLAETTPSASRGSAPAGRAPPLPPPTPYCPDSFGSRQVRSKGRRQVRGAMSWWTALGPHVPTG
ncbi:hypothetical protein QE370_001869 [Aeromicrobium sp. SORGH_AS981]|nr:hypothetical protein [Aeromicrobium sp. SORGH_AS_0981]